MEESAPKDRDEPRCPDCQAPSSKHIYRMHSKARPIGEVWFCGQCQKKFAYQSDYHKEILRQIKAMVEGERQKEAQSESLAESG